MTKPEITGRRDYEARYSRDHRDKLPHYCLMTDIDSIEYRIINGEPRPVAIVELKGLTKHGVKEFFKTSQYRLEKYIASVLKIPFFIVYRDEDKSFIVIDVFKKESFKVSEKDYWDGIASIYMDDEGRIIYNFKNKINIKVIGFMEVEE